MHNYWTQEQRAKFREWADELYSGNWVQCRGQLWDRTKTAHCCLGVYAIKAGQEFITLDTVSWWEAEGLIDWKFFADLNDQDKFSFEEIANVIEMLCLLDEELELDTTPNET